MEEMCLGRDMVIFILQNLGFEIKKEQSCMEPIRVMQFLGFIINSESMTIFLPEEKKKKIMSRCETLLNAGPTILWKIVSTLGILTSTYQAVLPGLLYYRSLQMQRLKHSGEPVLRNKCVGEN